MERVCCACHLLPQPQRIGGNDVVSFTEPEGVSGITCGAEWAPIADTGSGVTHTFNVPIGSNARFFLMLTVASP